MLELLVSCDHRYTPPQSQDQSKGLITPYAEIRQLEPPRPTNGLSNHQQQQQLAGNQASPSMSFRSFSQDDASKYDLLKPSLLKEDYDNLHPSPRHRHPLIRSRAINHASHFHHQRNNNSSGSYTQVSGSPLRQRNKARLSKSPSASPGRSPPRTARQSLPQMPSREEILHSSVEDLDTYVYMAPVSDYPDTSEGVLGAREMAGQGRRDAEVEMETESEVR